MHGDKLSTVSMIKGVPCQRLFPSKKLSSKFTVVMKAEGDPGSDVSAVLVRNILDLTLGEADRARVIMDEEYNRLICTAEMDQINPLVTRACWEEFFRGFSFKDIYTLVCALSAAELGLRYS
jgi:hypothetical protein